MFTFSLNRLETKPSGVREYFSRRDFTVSMGLPFHYYYLHSIPLRGASACIVAWVKSGARKKPRWVRGLQKCQGAQHQLKGKKRTTLTVTLLTQGVMPCNIFFANTVWQRVNAYLYLNYTNWKGTDMKQLITDCKQHFAGYTALVFGFGIIIGVLGASVYFLQAINGGN